MDEMNEVTLEEQQPMAGLTEGRVIRYVLPKWAQPNRTIRPAIVTRVHNVYTGLIDLSVFTLGEIDGRYFSQPVVVQLQVNYDDSGESDGTWHWPERV